jgi:hypothetical protein
MSGNNGTNITVYGSFSRSDNCDREFHRIAAKFGVKQEPVDFPSKSLAPDVKEDERVRKSKKKSDDPVHKISAVGPSAADSKASVDASKDLALAASTSDGITGVTKTTSSLDKIEDKKNPPLG